LISQIKINGDICNKKHILLRWAISMFIPFVLCLPPLVILAMLI
jgi:hypothetical protein